MDENVKGAQWEPGWPVQECRILGLQPGLDSHVNSIRCVLKGPRDTCGHDGFDSPLGTNRRLILQSAKVMTEVTDGRGEMLATCLVRIGNARGC